MRRPVVHVVDERDEKACGTFSHGLIFLFAYFLIVCLSRCLSLSGTHSLTHALSLPSLSGFL